jgi:CO/xanthine dehydrogenase Mo-binding subunit
MEPTEIGKSYRRLDYQTKVTGQAQYLADMVVPGMCHGKILRSPFPHARIKSIDASKAKQFPGVVAVITRDDILHDQGIEPFYGPVFKDQTIVATEKVRHVGDPVAAVAALTVDAAEEALKLIEVDYEELAAVLNVQEAIKQNPTLVHETVRIPESGFADLAELKPIDGTNICTHFKLDRGDIKKGFAITFSKTRLRCRQPSIVFSKPTRASRLSSPAAGSRCGRRRKTRLSSALSWLTFSKFQFRKCA